MKKFLAVLSLLLIAFSVFSSGDTTSPSMLPIGFSYTLDLESKDYLNGRFVRNLSDFTQEEDEFAFTALENETGDVVFFAPDIFFVIESNLTVIPVVMTFTPFTPQSQSSSSQSENVPSIGFGVSVTNNENYFEITKNEQIENTSKSKSIYFTIQENSDNPSDVFTYRIEYELDPDFDISAYPPQDYVSTITVTLNGEV